MADTITVLDKSFVKFILEDEIDTAIQKVADQINEDYKDDDEFRNDSFGNIYYHGEQQIEVVRGVNLIHCCEYFSAFNDFTKTGFKIIYDKTKEKFNESYLVSRGEYLSALLFFSQVTLTPAAAF